MDIIDHTPGTLVFISKPLANGFSSIHQHEVWTYISLKKMEKLALFEYTCCCSICSMNFGDFFKVGCHLFQHVSAPKRWKISPQSCLPAFPQRSRFLEASYPAHLEPDPENVGGSKENHDLIASPFSSISHPRNGRWTRLLGNNPSCKWWKNPDYCLWCFFPGHLQQIQVIAEWPGSLMEPICDMTWRLSTLPGIGGSKTTFLKNKVRSMLRGWQILENMLITYWCV